MIALLLGQLASVAPSAPAAPSWAGPSAPAPPVVERWSARQTLLGVRTIPLLGDYETRTDVWALAEVTRSPGRWHVRQTACELKVQDVAGVSIAFPQAGVRNLPPTTFDIVQRPDGSAAAAPWPSGWGEQDYDGDGWPGMTLSVRAPLCKGRLGIVSDTTTQAVVRHASEVALVLELFLKVGQKTMASEGWCLALADEQQDDRFHGLGRYERLPEGAGCAEVMALPPVLRLTKE